jgi:hypothetical protein
VLDILFLSPQKPIFNVPLDDLNFLDLCTKNCSRQFQSHKIMFLLSVSEIPHLRGSILIAFAAGEFALLSFLSFINSKLTLNYLESSPWAAD